MNNSVMKCQNSKDELLHYHAVLAKLAAVHRETTPVNKAAEFGPDVTVEVKLEYKTKKDMKTRIFCMRRAIAIVFSLGNLSTRYPMTGPKKMFAEPVHKAYVKQYETVKGLLKPSKKNGTENSHILTLQEVIM